jgi:hypothetical protein
MVQQTQEVNSRQRKVGNREVVREVQKTIFRGELGENVFSVKRKRDKVQETDGLQQESTVVSRG